MEIQKYTIWARYSYFGKSGKELSKWFRQGVEYNTEEEAKIQLNKYKNNIKNIDKTTKQKHEYEIRNIDITLLPQRKLHRQKGRPKKISDDIINKIIKDLIKGKDVKIEDTIAPVLFNDAKLQRYIYDEINKKINDKWVRYWYDDNNFYIMLKSNFDEILY